MLSFNQSQGSRNQHKEGLITMQEETPPDQNLT